MTNPENLIEATIELERTLREKSPLVHHLTNYVVMNFTANITLAIGAQPVMAHAPQELEEMVGYASALVLNIGTLDHGWIESMIIAGTAASRRGIPVILDPVGAGATKLHGNRAQAPRRSCNFGYTRKRRRNSGTRWQEWRRTRRRFHRRIEHSTGNRPATSRATRTHRCRDWPRGPYHRRKPHLRSPKR